MQYHGVGKMKFLFQATHGAFSAVVQPKCNTPKRNATPKGPILWKQGFLPLSRPRMLEYEVRKWRRKCVNMKDRLPFSKRLKHVDEVPEICLLKKGELVQRSADGHLYAG